MESRLFQRFLGNTNNINEKRSKLIKLTSIIGIATNILFAIIKLIIGFFANSVSITSDAVNNLTDAISSLITLVGLKLSNRPPDRKHPLGYGRIEYISGMVIATIVLVTGLEFLKTSIERVMNPQMVNFEIIQFIILGVTIIGKWGLSYLNIKVGKTIDSSALIASGADAKMDVLVSTLTIVAAIISLLTGLLIDGYVGVLLSLFIIYTGINLIRETISSIIGERADKELSESIKEEVMKFEPIVGAYDLILHNYGPTTRLGSLNLEIPDTVTVETAYAAMSGAQSGVYLKYGIYFTFGLYSVNTYNQEIDEVQIKVKQIVESMNGTISLHAFNYDNKKKIIRFDTVVDFTVHDFIAFKAHLVDKILLEYPNFTVITNIELDYS